ncbi:MAG: type II toxin-antitoxin system HicB family antitoxin [Ignavibacteriae bacterium HGW-Ignavibacteriae-4]|jgi:predicted RNase H-like HicB family nuclease|nr:MAG: type II toxin-antitoxin system HicB family antitoxin [Ignavibacteriae bacterium HGW-Ignavibacteriae-4]
MKTKFTIKIETTSTGYSAYVEEYPIYTTDTTISELLSNMNEALKLYNQNP